MKRRWLIILSFVIGIGFIAYPTVDRTIQEYKQNQLLTEWSLYKDLTEQVNLNHKVVPLGGQTNEQDREGLEQASNIILPRLDGVDVLGTIQIPSIDAFDPILLDATDKSLKVGIGSVVPGRLPGENGNFVLAGHRSFTHGKQFSRLNELEEGDEIVVESVNDTYHYEVTSSFLVKPDELWVLDDDIEGQSLTLITCHPARNPTHRLIVKAELQKE